MRDTLYAKPQQRLAALPRAYAMISRSPVHCAEFFFEFREARRSTPMTAADRFTRSCRTILFLIVSFGLPSLAAAASLEDSAKELAQKIAVVLPAQVDVSVEVRNLSSLQPGEVAQIEQAFKAELQERGVRLSASGGVAITVVVTLSENFKAYFWTGDIRQGETSRVVLIDVRRSTENRTSLNAMPAAIRSEKFWEGPEHILDAGEISNGAGRSWLFLLLPGGLLIRDRPTGLEFTIEVTSNQSASRDPRGNLNFGQIGNTIGLFLPPRMCTVNLETRTLTECVQTDGSDVPVGGRSLVLIDLVPPGPPTPGKGTEIAMGAVCGGASQFLATGGRDYTQTDSLQVFETESSGAVAVSAELGFPGPITALHAVSDTPRAIVRNLTTGNYEAYRLSFSCGQ